MKIFAHRGASAYAPENTLSAFALAWEMGAAGIELDTQLSMDGELVIIHDFELGRVSNGKGLVRDHTLSQLRALDFGSWFSKDFAGEPIMTLQEVLTWIKPTGMALNIEIKTTPVLNDRQIVPKTIQFIHASGIQERILISSFDHRCLAEVKRVDKDIPVGLLYMAGLLDVGAYAAACGAEFIHPHFSFVDGQTRRECAGHGVGMNVWTVDDPDQAIRLRTLGADGLITNMPDRMIKAIAQ